MYYYYIEANDYLFYCDCTAYIDDRTNDYYDQYWGSDIDQYYYYWRDGVKADEAVMMAYDVVSGNDIGD